MRNDKPAIVDLSEMQHDHSSNEQGGLLALHLYFAASILGALDAGAVSAVWTVPETCTLPAGLTGSVASCGSTTLPTGDCSFEIQKNGAAIGTVDFTTATQAATFTFSSSVGLVAGDRLTLVNPDPADASLAKVGITLRANR